MRESYSEGLARYAGPESCTDCGDTVGVATAGVHAGKLLSSPIIIDSGEVAAAKFIYQAATAASHKRLTLVRPELGDLGFNCDTLRVLTPAVIARMISA